MSLTESIVEGAALTWFLLRQDYGGQVGELGYSVVQGAAFAGLRRAKPSLAKGELAVGRDSFGEVVLVGYLREALCRLNPAISNNTLANLCDMLPRRHSGLGGELSVAATSATMKASV